MDTTTQERAQSAAATEATARRLIPNTGLGEALATAAETIVNRQFQYQPGGRGLDGQGLDGFGFLRLCCMAATGRQLHDLFGYPGWPDREPRDTRVANLLDDWGLTVVGDYMFSDFRRGDVLVFQGRHGPACDIVVSPANHDRAALVAACWAETGPVIRPYANRVSGGLLVRVCRWVEAS